MMNHNMEANNGKFAILKYKIMRKKTLLLIILLLGFYPIFAQEEIPLKDYFRTLKIVEVEIGDKTYNFLFDTGGGITIVSPQIIEEMNKTSYGNSIGFRMSGEKVESKICDSIDIKIGGVNYFHPHVGVFDVMSVLPKDLGRIDGLISLKTFEHSKITLNLIENKLIVETEESFEERIKNMTLVKSRFANGQNGSELIIFLGTKKENHLWWFLFDSGNISNAIISKRIAKEWGIPYGDDETTDIGVFNFELAGDSIATPATIYNIIYDGAFSFDFIRQAEFTISISDKKVWMKAHKTN